MGRSKSHASDRHHMRQIDITPTRTHTNKHTIHTYTQTNTQYTHTRTHTNKHTIHTYTHMHTQKHKHTHTHARAPAYDQNWESWRPTRHESHAQTHRQTYTNAHTHTHTRTCVTSKSEVMASHAARKSHTHKQTHTQHTHAHTYTHQNTHAHTRAHLRKIKIGSHGVPRGTEVGQGVGLSIVRKPDLNLIKGILLILAFGVHVSS